MVDALHVYSPHILKTLKDTIRVTLRFKGETVDITRGFLRFATAMLATILSASIALLIAINGPSISG